jgi:hypothetical protein
VHRTKQGTQQPAGPTLQNGPALFFDPAWLRKETPLGLAWAAGNTLSGRTGDGALRAVIRKHAHALRRVNIHEIWFGWCVLGDGVVFFL